MLMFSDEWHAMKRERFCLPPARSRPKPAKAKSKARKPKPVAMAIPKPTEPTPAPEQRPARVLENTDCDACNGDGFFLVDGDVTECQACSGLGYRRES